MTSAGPIRRGTGMDYPASFLAMEEIPGGLRARQGAESMEGRRGKICRMSTAGRDRAIVRCAGRGQEGGDGMVASDYFLTKSAGQYSPGTVIQWSFRRPLAVPR
jgi:hypothetical protein